jgi:hypothetical protein
MLTIRQEQMNAFVKALNRPPVMPCKRDWIEIRLTDKWNEPVPNAAYEIILTDDTLITGNLDDKGCVRFDDIAPGVCQVKFPELEPDDSDSDE